LAGGVGGEIVTVPVIFCELELTISVISVVGCLRRGKDTVAVEYGHGAGELKLD